MCFSSCCTVCSIVRIYRGGGRSCIPANVERLAVVTERSEVGVQNAAEKMEGLSTLSEGVRVFVAVSAVASVFVDRSGASRRWK